MRRSLLFLTTLFICLSSAGAGNYYFSHLTMDEGLSHNCVNAVVQDSEGFIWIGTRNGLNRYDGSRIREFECRDALTGHGNNNISALYADPETGLWCGTDKGVYIWSARTESFSEFTACTGEGKRITDWIATIDKDSYGNMWIVAPNQGVFRYDGHELFSYGIPLPECLYVRKNGQVWIGTYSSGIYIYDPEKDELERLHTDNAGNSILGEYVFSLCEWNSSMVIGIHDGNLKYYDLKSSVFGTMDTPGIHGTMIRGLGNFSHNLWVCTHEGVFIIDGKDRSVSHITKDFLNPYGLSDKVCSVLCQDSEGGIWVGTLLNGVNYCAATGFKISKYILYDKVDRVLFDNIRTISEAPDGKIWAGTENEGICSFDPSTGEVRALARKYVRKHRLLNTLGSRVSRDGRYLWTGFFKRGFTRVDMVTGQMEYFRPQDYGIEESSIYSFCRDSRDNIWIGTASGVYLKKAEDETFAIVDTLSTFWAFDIMEDSRRNVWFASLGGGLYRYDPAHDDYVFFCHKPGDSTSLSINSVSGIMEDSRGAIWFSTDRGGLSGYRYETGSFDNYSVEDGFPDNVTYRAVEDQSGILWIGTDKGLVKFNPETQAVRVFTKTEGLLCNQFNYHSAMVAHDGRLWFGVKDGLMSVDPLQQESESDNMPRIYFTNLVVNNEVQTVGGDGSVLGESLCYTDRIVLKHNQSDISVDFADVRFSRAYSTAYYYRMEGTGTDWIEIAGDRSVSFARLAPGDYVLHIKAVTVNGHTNVAERSLSITVRNPWWASVTAKCVYCLLFIAGVSLLVALLYRRKKRQMEISKNIFEMEKEKELYSAKVEFFNEIAHEIRTPLTLIKGPLEDAIEVNRDSRVSKNLRTVSTNAERLLELVNQLLDFRNVDSQRMQLDFVRFDVVRQLHHITERFEPTMEKSGKSFRFAAGTDSFMATADKEAFTKIISNLLTNAIKYSERNIEVIFVPGEAMFSVRVSSDGDRIPIHLSEKIFEPFFRIENPGSTATGTGIGLPMARSLAQMHKGHLFLDTASSANTFVLTLPVGQEKYINLESSGVIALQDTSLDDTAVLDGEEKGDSTATYSILLAEDNSDVLGYLADKFRESCTVFTAGNGSEALDILSTQRVDLVVSDIMMPEMDGLELCRRIKGDEVLRSLPVVFLTARNDLKSKVEGLQIGAEAFIEKPFSFAYLKALAFSIMDNRRKEREDFLRKPFVKINNIHIDSADEEFVNGIVAIIESEMASENLNVELLAERMNMNRTTLLRRIKNITGFLPVDFIRVIRLKKAAELIRSGTMRVNEVCYAVGIGSPSYFSRLFYKQFGVRPKDFEKQEKQNTNETK